ncbi:MAG: hypothetical protein MMC33_009397 [Icmadophila ericetorum]|nr:hypothetical protein [Icmadophila ericetorum]
MAPSIAFTLHPAVAADECSLRLGTLTYSPKSVNSQEFQIPTPNYIPLTSRGTIPHVTQDMYRDNLKGERGVYIGLEDYIERHTLQSPFYSIPCNATESPLRKFISLQPDTFMVLGPRRIPSIPCPASNTGSSLSILTSVGFGNLEVEDYIEAARRIKPDVAIGIGDVVLEEQGVILGVKRREKMVERTGAWMRAFINSLGGENRNIALFAPVLPVDAELQSQYLADLHEEPDWASAVTGLALYQLSSIEAIPPELSHLPRLALYNPSTPLAVLHNINLGIDIFTLPFISKSTDAGVTFTFVFPAPPLPSSQSPLSSSSPNTALPRERLPLAENLWNPSYARSRSPLSKTCQCYACKRHHRAYIHHLLSAKEMLAWVLLQIHNHSIMDEFFHGVRESIKQGTLESDVQKFASVYEEEIVSSQGLGPRIRGYQHHSPHVVKAPQNPKAFKKYDIPPVKTASNPNNAIPNAQGGCPDDWEVNLGGGDDEWAAPDVEGEELEKAGFGMVDDDYDEGDDGDEGGVAINV